MHRLWICNAIIECNITGQVCIFDITLVFIDAKKSTSTSSIVRRILPAVPTVTMPVIVDKSVVETSATIDKRATDKPAVDPPATAVGNMEIRQATPPMPALSTRPSTSSVSSDEIVVDGDPTGAACVMTDGKHVRYNV